MSEDPAAVVVPKAAELVADRIRREIVTGERVEGEMLPPEIVLCGQLGVSRPTLRQALRILESELLVTVLRGRNGGTRVNRPSAEVAGRYLGNILMFEGATLDDVHTARLLLEPTAVAELAGRLTPAQLAELTELAAAGHAVEDDPEQRRMLGGSFHTALVRMTGNPVVALFAQLIQGLIDAHSARFESRRQRDRVPSRSAELLDVHDRLLELLAAGAGQEAARLWHGHLVDVHATLSAALDTTRVLDLDL